MSRAAVKTSNRSSGGGIRHSWSEDLLEVAPATDIELPVGKNLSEKVKAIVAGEAGFKEWSDLRNWLKLTGWVDVEWEDEEGDPRAPDEDAIADAAESADPGPGVRRRTGDGRAAASGVRCRYRRRAWRFAPCPPRRPDDRPDLRGLVRDAGRL
eukprot:jgi/Tetstr1/458084/TSEL_044591.t1